MWQLATEGLTLINTEAGALNKNNFQGMIRIEATLFNVKIMKFSPPLHQPNYVQVLFYCIFLPSRLNRGKVNLVFDPHLIGDFTIKIFKPKKFNFKVGQFCEIGKY